MKRCPECEFIYEDEQITCDMDGTTLSFDAISTTDTVKQGPLRSLAVPAIIGTMLAGLLFIAFHASPLLLANPDARSRPPEEQTLPTNRPDPPPTAAQVAEEQPSAQPSPAVASEKNNSEQEGLTAAVDPTTAETNNTNSRSADSRLTIRRGLPPLPRVPSLPRLPPAKVGKQRHSTGPNKNREGVQLQDGETKRTSKVGSLLKKTGNIIKKPFKF